MDDFDRAEHGKREEVLPARNWDRLSLREGIAEQLTAIPDGDERVLLATGRCIEEGFDDARLDTLFPAMPIS